MSLKIKPKHNRCVPSLGARKKRQNKTGVPPQCPYSSGQQGGALMLFFQKREMHVAMVFVVSVLLNVELMQCQFVHKGPYQVVCGEVEDQSEEY